MQNIQITEDYPAGLVILRTYSLHLKKSIVTNMDNCGCCSIHKMPLEYIQYVKISRGVELM